MLVVLLCCMMKIVEFSTGKPLMSVGKSRGNQHHQREKKPKNKHYYRKKGKTMEGGTLTVHHPAVDADCNSNRHNNSYHSNSYLSNSSSQDFVQDNSDYQWFLDYGYRDGANQHTSILSLPEAYETNDVTYYEALSKNMDANLAEADMESFRTEDIHALLTNLPPMCTDHLSQETNRQGESYASVSGSMMAKFDFDSSHDDGSTSHDDSANSIYASELLFSPVKEMPVFGPNYSVDSLDCDMMLTCQANKDNYTIAFEGSVTMYSEDSDYHEMDRSIYHPERPQPTTTTATTTSMTQSDSGSMTTWSNLKKQTSQMTVRCPSGNNNNSENENISLIENSKSHSMPNLYKQKLKQTNSAAIDYMPRSVRVFDMANSDSKHPNFSLVKLFMKQKSISTEGMSTTMDQLSSVGSQSDTSEQLNNNNSDLLSKSIQTSHFSEVSNLKKQFNSKPAYKIMEGSFLNKLRESGEAEKPVYVLYPNYVLPDLDFLQNKPKNLYLLPQKVPTARAVPRRRPFSFNDVEMLKKKGFSHVKDWDSLNFLLPQEYRNILSSGRKTSDSKSSTSSGYKGSSTILNESQNNSNPLFVYRYDSVTSSEASLVTDSRQKTITTAPPLPVRCVSLQHDHRIPPRPPLPKNIIRKKHYSLYETSEEDLATSHPHHPPHPIRRRPRHSETEDEGVDAGTSSSSLDDTPYRPDPKSEELAQLQEFLKLSGFSMSDNDEENLVQLRSHVSEFLSLKLNTNRVLNNSPNISTFVKQNLIDMPICEESESPNNSPKHLNSVSPKHLNNSSMKQLNADLLKHLTVDSLKHFNTTPSKQLTIDSTIAANMTDITEAVKLITSQFGLTDTTDLVLNHLCPALYSLLSDGLKPNLETSFGAINNSVWQVVEASAQQGPLTKALNELVMRINSEDVITEGLVKFNAFVFGLLNVRSLDAWVSYLRTRETILKKHYTTDSIWVLANTGGGNYRSLMDKLVTGLQPLALLPYQLDLLYEYKQLHASFRRLEQMNVRKERPRSCIEPPKLNFKIGDLSKKRWSGIPPNSKLYLAYDKIASEDEYTDSLEPESLDTKPINGKKFKTLQQKWEKISGEKVTTPVSKIPRPITSPSGIPVLMSPTGKPKQFPGSTTPGSTTTCSTPKKTPVGNTTARKAGSSSTPNKTKIRTSRVDLDKIEVQKHTPRPSSLPYKTAAKNSKGDTPRRAASSSASRKNSPNYGSHRSIPKYVKTLSHRLPSESGHLAYNEGEKLKVVLEVDEKWLLCCRGFQKGLVPKSAVISADSRFTS